MKNVRRQTSREFNKVFGIGIKRLHVPLRLVKTQKFKKSWLDSVKLPFGNLLASSSSGCCGPGYRCLYINAIGSWDVSTAGDSYSSPARHLWAGLVVTDESPYGGCGQNIDGAECGGEGYCCEEDCAPWIQLRIDYSWATLEDTYLSTAYFDGDVWQGAGGYGTGVKGSVTMCFWADAARNLHSCAGSGSSVASNTEACDLKLYTPFNPGTGVLSIRAEAKNTPTGGTLHQATANLNPFGSINDCCD